jgi:hypothetical protein
MGLSMNSATPETPRSIADRIEAMDHALRVSELAGLLSWSPSLLYDRARSGRMGRAVIRVGGTVRFDPYWTAQWLREQSS